MNVNPAGAVLLIVGVVALIAGIRGSQSQTFALVFGRPSKGAAPSSSSSVSAPGSGAHPPAPVSVGGTQRVS